MAPPTFTVATGPATIPAQLLARRTRSHGEHGEVTRPATNQATPLFNVPGYHETIPPESTIAIATCELRFATLCTLSHRGTPTLSRGQKYAAQLVKPSPKAHYLGPSAGTGKCRKSLARRCRVPLVDKGGQGKSTDHPPAEESSIKERSGHD